MLGSHGKITIFLSLLFILFALPTPVSATDHKPILIISSYNPDSHNTAMNISDFMDELNRLGYHNQVIIENMNCKSFSESSLWAGKMKQILLKYQTDFRPALILLLGQEAWASYLTLNDSTIADIPVMVAMASQNAVILPSENDSLSSWMPESINLATGSPKHRIRGGVVYHYDIKGNLDLIKKLYPETTNIALITDNSYGGVAMQSLVRKKMANYPEFNLILLDGRTSTIYNILDQLRELPEQTVLLMGTWRVDKNDGYFMRNATYSMMDVVPHIPTFSISSVGLGYWAIGGIIPVYAPQGKMLAEQAVSILFDPTDTSSCIVFMPNQLQLDYNKVKELHIDLSQFPSNTVLINKSPSLYELYKYEIWTLIIAISFLLLSLCILLLFYFRTKRLKDKLIVSEAELRVAKDKAEDSNRLKSAFLANMSHEIRTPLNSIVGFSNVLAGGDSSAEDQKLYAEIIQSNSDLLLRLINDILDISRLETDKVSFSLEEADIILLMQQVVTSMGYLNKNNNRLILETDVPALTMVTDVQRLQQVLINLISNASKFTSNGLITLAFEIDSSAGQAIFSVADTGPGIPEEKSILIFERFEKLNEYVQGTGLGLSICRLIINKLGGDIWVDSTYTSGARFVFTHPLNINYNTFAHNQV